MPLEEKLNVAVVTTDIDFDISQSWKYFNQIRDDHRFRWLNEHSRVSRYELIEPKGNTNQFSFKLRQALSQGKNVVVSWSDNSMYENIAQTLAKEHEASFSTEVLDPAYPNVYSRGVVPEQIYRSRFYEGTTITGIDKDGNTAG